MGEKHERSERLEKHSSPPSSPAEEPKKQSREGTLSAFLHKAKPQWMSKDLDAAMKKLNKVSIFTIEALAEALLHVDDNFLNERLKSQDQRAFSDDTLRAFRLTLHNTP